MRKLIFGFIFLMLSVSLVSAEYFSDIIITGPNGVWIDARAYTSLQAAVTAAGANQRSIHIYSQQSCTDLTIGSNITLEFGREGSIANTGTLTIQTKNIIAQDRQIFTGVGQIDFADGTNVRSAWFQNFESALALTSNDSVILLVTKPQSTTASFAVGDDVYLKWESPNNVITIGAGTTISNIRHIEAGDYQILAGSGTATFVNDVELNLNWFTNLRTILTWLGATEATLYVKGTNTVDYTDTSSSNIVIDIKPGATLSISNTKTLTIQGVLINRGTISGLGTLLLSGAEVENYRNISMSTALSVVNSKIINSGTIDTSPTFTIDSDSSIVNNGVINDSAITFAGSYSGIGIIDTANAISMTGIVDIPAGVYVFQGAGTVTGLNIARPEWWGTDATILGKAIAALQ